jgi:HD-GYP domain-containing protein (c-di-GMP phosphodiesterase class II)
MDDYTYGHSERVARIAVQVGQEFGLRGAELGNLYLAGLLHDVGKIGIDYAVLQKREPLTRAEEQQVQKHVTIGCELLAGLRPLRGLVPAVLHHHERYDGAGYPHGLLGESIPLSARVLAVADACDAMSRERPYREAIPTWQVREIFIEEAGAQWDGRVVEAFLRCRHRVEAVKAYCTGESLRRAVEDSVLLAGY